MERYSLTRGIVVFEVTIFRIIRSFPPLTQLSEYCPQRNCIMSLESEYNNGAGLDNINAVIKGFKILSSNNAFKLLQGLVNENASLREIQVAYNTNLRQLYEFQNTLDEERTRSMEKDNTIASIGKDKANLEAYLEEVKEQLSAKEQAVSRLESERDDKELTVRSLLESVEEKIALVSSVQTEMQNTKVQLEWTEKKLESTKEDLGITAARLNELSSHVFEMKKAPAEDIYVLVHFLCPTSSPSLIQKPQYKGAKCYVQHGIPLD